MKNTSPVFWLMSLMLFLCVAVRTSAQDLKAELAYPSAGYIYQSGDPLSVHVQITNAGPQTLEVYDSVAVRFFLDGNPLTMQVNGVPRQYFQIAPPYSIYPWDTAGFSFQLSQASFTYDSTLSGTRNFCVEVNTIRGLDSNMNNNTSCRSLMLHPGQFTRPGLLSISPSVTGNAGVYSLTITGALLPANAGLKLTRSDSTDMSIPDSLVSVAAGGTKLIATPNLSEADTGLWHVVVSVPGDTVMTLPNALRIAAPALQSVTPASASNREMATIRIQGARLPLSPAPSVRLLSTRDTIYAGSSMYGHADSSVVVAGFNLWGHEAGIYDVEVSIPGAPFLYLPGGFVVSNGNRRTDASIASVRLTTGANYKSGDSTRISGTMFIRPILPLPSDTAQKDSILISFSLAGKPLPVVINEKKDSSYVIAVTPSINSIHGFSLPLSYFTVDSPLTGLRQFCATIRSLTFDDSLAGNNTACTNINLTPGPPSSGRPAIHSVYPPSGGNTGIWPVTISGARMASSARLKLVRAGSTDIVAPDSATEWTGAGWGLKSVVDLRHADTGTWDVVVTIPGDTVMTLPAAFRVTPMQIKSMSPSNHINQGSSQIRVVLSGLPPQSVPEILLIRGDTLSAPGTIVYSRWDSSVVSAQMNFNGGDTGIYDLAVRVPGGHLVRKAGIFRVDPRRGAGSMFSNISVTVDTARTIFSETDTTLILQVSIRHINGDSLMVGDSMRIGFTINGRPFQLTTEGKTDTVFTVQLDRMLHGFASGSFTKKFLASVHAPLDTALRARSQICAIVQGVSFTDTVISNNTACRYTSYIDIAPKKRIYTVLPDKVGNVGTTKLSLHGLGLGGPNRISLTRPGYSSWHMTNPTYSFLDSGRRVDIYIDPGGIAPGLWTLTAGFWDTALNIPLQIVTPEILTVSPAALGYSGATNSSFVLQINTRGVGQTGGVLLKNGTTVLYGTVIGNTSADLKEVRFNTYSTFLTQADYDLEIELTGQTTRVTKQKAVRFGNPVRTDPEVYVTGPTAARTGYRQSYEIHVTNTSNIPLAGFIVPFATTHDSVFIRGISNHFVPVDSFDGHAFIGKAGILQTDSIGPGGKKVISLTAVTHGSPAAPAVLKAGAYVLQAGGYLYDDHCLTPILRNLPGLADTLPYGCLVNMLGLSAKPGVSDYGRRVAEAWGSCSGNTDTDSLERLITRHLVNRVRPDSAVDCDTMFVQLGRHAVSTELLWSYDPNDKHGPSGAGPQHHVHRNERMFHYLVNYENDSAAKAAAQIVRVTDTLDKSVFDMSSFRVDAVRIADTTILIPGDVGSYSAFIDFRNKGKNYLVQVEAGLDTASGVATWTMTTIDPLRMTLTTDPYTGFLPPNRTAPEGQGSVFFRIGLKDSLPDNTQIQNTASIYFDGNPPIITHTFSNIIDRSKPASQVDTQPRYILDDTTTRVTWGGTDAGSGVLSYTVYVSDNGGPFLKWIRETPEQEALFTGRYDNEYAFYSVATDSVGNQEEIPAGADTRTTFIRCADKLRISLDTAGELIFCAGESATLKVTGGQRYLWNDQSNRSAISITESGSYYVRVTDSFGCVVHSDTTEFTVLPLPAPPVITRIEDTLYSSYADSNRWYRNGTLLPEANGRSCLVTAAGDYQVFHTDPNGCTAASEIRRIEGRSAVSGHTSGNRIYIYPNPAEVFTIEGPAPGQQDVFISVFTMQGQLARTEQLRSGSGGFTYQLDLSGLASGTYWITVLSGDVHYSGKITRQ